MKFLKFLSESGFQGSDTITFEDAVDIAKKNCMKNLFETPYMFKDINRYSIDSDYMIVRPSSSERRSANTKNYYTWLMS